MSATSNPLSAYNELISTSIIQPDPLQYSIVNKLQSLNKKLDEYNVHQHNWLNFTRFFTPLTPPKGIYIYGGVGRGKSMLMEIFFQNSIIKKRRRVHFHAFMQEVHNQLNNLQKSQKSGRMPRINDPLSVLAKKIANQAFLLCFDEFHVTDIADAMILGRLFKNLFDSGVVLVTTSNRRPKDLYKDGLQRELFLPFIDMIEEKMEVTELNGDVDYRLNCIEDMDTFISPIDDNTKSKLEEHFSRLTIGAVPEAIELIVMGKIIKVPKTAEGVAMISFSSLCKVPHGPADYLAICSRFHTLILEHIPRMGPENRNSAKRFVTLIDTMYEARVNLICSSEVTPEKLYVSGDGAFEFRRTVSRIMEMRSSDYISKEHLSIAKNSDSNLSP